MRKYLFLFPLLLSVLVCGCGKSTSDIPISSANPGSTDYMAGSAEESAKNPAVTVSFGHIEDGSKESAIISGLDVEGNEVWTYETESHDMTELTRVEEIGLKGEIYYFNDSGTITALDLYSGEVIWSNSEFGGASISYAFSDDNVLYLCGYYGPDFFAVDIYDGSTEASIPSFDSDYFWASGIETAEDGIIVTMRGGPEGDNPDGHTFRVNPDNYSYE